MRQVAPTFFAKEFLLGLQDFITDDTSPWQQEVKKGISKAI
jgi:hypothetical protein